MKVTLTKVLAVVGAIVSVVFIYKLVKFAYWYFTFNLDGYLN